MKLFGFGAASTGARGEEMAARWYRRRGWTVLDQNYRTRQGELDLVVSRQGVLAFVEVKTRTGQPLGRPCEAVDARKQQRIIAAASYYLMCHPQREEPTIRFDVLEVWPDRREEERFNCIENAFGL